LDGDNRVARQVAAWKNQKAKYLLAIRFSEKIKDESHDELPYIMGIVGILDPTVGV
jgi:hypothetical protein